MAPKFRAVALSVMLCGAAVAQVPRDSAAARERNAVSADFFGMAVNVSVNVERSVVEWRNHAIIVKAGAGGGIRLENNIDRRRTWMFPAAVLFSSGGQLHRIETGAGITFCTGPRRLLVHASKSTLDPDVYVPFQTNVLCFAYLGYRYDWPGSRFFARAAFTPLFARFYPNRAELNSRTFSLYTWAGGGIGMRF